MPRKYRPPAARRRRTSRAQPAFVEPIPEDGAVAPAAAEETIPTVERVEPPVAEPSVSAGSSERSSPAATRHIARDYSYVRAEVRRIVLVAGFLIVALIITALLRD